MVKAGAVVIDVGINRTEAGLVGDVDPGAAEVAAYHHAGARRRGADDDRLPARERRPLRALPPWRSLRIPAREIASVARAPPVGGLVVIQQGVVGSG